MDGLSDAHRAARKETIRRVTRRARAKVELSAKRMSAFVENARGEIAS